MNNYYESNTHHHGRNEDIYNRFLDLFDYALTIRPRNLVVSCVIRFPNDNRKYDEAAIFGRFLATFTQNRNRPRKKATKGYGCLYFWKRERVINPMYEGVKHGHYHVAFIFSERETQNMYGHMEYANELWNSYFPSNNDYTPGECDVPHKDKRLVHYRNHHEGNGIVLKEKSSNYMPEVLRVADWIGGYFSKNYSSDRFGKHGNGWNLSKGIPTRPYLNHFNRF